METKGSGRVVSKTTICISEILGTKAICFYLKKLYQMPIKYFIDFPVTTFGSVAILFLLKYFYFINSKRLAGSVFTYNINSKVITILLLVI